MKKKKFPISDNFEKFKAKYLKNCHYKIVENFFGESIWKDESFYAKKLDGPELWIFFNLARVIHKYSFYFKEVKKFSHKNQKPDFSNLRSILKHTNNSSF